MDRNDGSIRTRTISRTRRRSRFRSTMMCPYFGTIIPTRAHNDGEAVTRTSSSPDFTRFPVCLTNSISGARESRCARENFRCDVACALEVERGRTILSAPFVGMRRGAWLAAPASGCVTRQRTSTATAPSTACAPSCGDALIPHAPNAWTCAREIHAS